METLEMKTFEWCGYEWTCVMDGGRRIHPRQAWMWYDDQSMRIKEDKSIELFINKKQTQIKHWDGNTYKPTIACGTIRSVAKFSYGVFSAEIMLPRGVNLWPSFWLTGAKNWPPEIDIVEAWSGTNNYFKMTIAQPPYLMPSWRTTTNIHYNNENMEHDSRGSRNISWFKQHKNPSENFIKYECIWEPNKITFIAGGKVVRVDSGHECEMLTNNIKDKDKGFDMNVIFNVWCEDPSLCNVDMYSPMTIKNFEYKPL